MLIIFLKKDHAGCYQITLKLYYNNNCNCIKYIIIVLIIFKIFCLEVGSFF